MNRFRRIPHSGRPLVLAHRGDSSHAPENTLEAAIRGHAAGADGWELDVRLTRDEIPIVLHDASLVRTTDVVERFADDPRAVDGFRVTDFDWDEIRTLDAGSWFVAPNGGPRSARAFGTLDRLSDADRTLFGSGQVRVPSLADALRLTLELDWMVNVELKTFSEGNGPRMVAKVVEMARSMNLGERLLISSFDHADLGDLSRSLPGATSGVLTVTPLRDPRRYVRDVVGADFYHPSAEVLGAGSDRYRKRPDPAHLGCPDLVTGELPTFVYTVNDPAVAADLARIGVAGIFSDDPARLLAVWEASRRCDPESSDFRSAAGFEE